MLLSVIGLCGCLFPSCSNDDGNTPTPGMSGNSFVYGNVESKIESVVYTVDERQANYAFYFSPTRGLDDLGSMLTADDYILVVTPAPTGAIDLMSAGNRLTYKQIDVSAATGDKVATAALSLSLTSPSAVRMSLDVAMKSGETLRAEYDGACLKLDEQQDEVRLTDKIFGYYMGTAGGNAGTAGYYVALTNAQWEGAGTQFNLTSEGYALVVDFYGAPGETWRDMPTGSFTQSDNGEDHTFKGDYSAVLYRDDKGLMQMFALTGPVKIEREADVMTVSASFFDKNHAYHTLVYRGELKLNDATLNVRLPQIDDDVFIDGAYASGVYNGDVFENGSGLTEITIYDRKAENGEPNGSAMTIALFSTKFTDPQRERRLIPGTYQAATTYAQGTWMPTVELEILGMIVPMGTFVTYADGTQQGAYAYAASGDVVIREGGNNTYTIEFDLQSISGHAIRGSYTGEVYLEDQSRDDKNDGTSNLDNDYELDLSLQSRANCYPQEEIWVRGLGTVSVETACEYSGREYGFQQVWIGTGEGVWEITDEYPADKGRGKLIEDDVLRIDLLVQKGLEDKITPGTYPITTNRYPVLFGAGVCVCGYNCFYGTSMLRVMSAIGWGYPSGYYDPDYTVANGWLNVPQFGKYASIYSGVVTVAKADGGDGGFPHGDTFRYGNIVGADDTVHGLRKLAVESMQGVDSEKNRRQMDRGRDADDTARGEFLAVLRDKTFGRFAAVHFRL